MPPFHNVLKLAQRSQGCSQGTSTPGSYASLCQSSRILAAAETVSRCFSNPYGYGSAWRTQPGVLLVEAVESVSSRWEGGASVVSRHGSGRRQPCNFSLPLAVGVSHSEGIVARINGDRDRDRDRDRFRNGLSTNLNDIHRSFSFHFFQTPWNSVSTFGGDAFVRLMHDIHSSRGHAAGPGVIACRTVSEDGDCKREAEGRGIILSEKTLRLNSGACCLPHPDKVDKGGEDAHFICSDMHAVGVADGVGGWADVGVDAGLYARELMNQSAKALAEEPPGAVDPERVLKKAHEKTKCRGSSTACILILADHMLQAANVGDSGFIVIRNGRTLFKSPPQQHTFNFPYQLGSEAGDPPECVELYELPVVAGDVLVLGTDGLFDNVFDSELSSLVMHSTKAGWSPLDTAERIAAVARLRANDPLRMSPFSRAAQEAGYRYWGGKMDDITVVVSYVTAAKE